MQMVLYFYLINFWQNFFFKLNGLNRQIFYLIANSLWGGITVKNNGGFVAKFTITYKLNGEYQTIDSGRITGKIFDLI